MKNEEIDEGFVTRQRERLERLREELVQRRRGMEEDERERSEEQQDVQPDSGDQSRYMFDREMDATIGERAARRLEDVERALEKIEEGTYGICDDTGQPIPRGRLEAMPEAIRTVEAQERFERERRPGR
ncbi:TraR/DksA family transcriptional regulator [Rubrobacter calidifluminis]|uniref:TraR/DksA family transcriptional regulator n=1 Tax=Rubrobacter calidifluminis TaxID=1392640 RepID=UPI002360E9A0|nr:TraR/DksA C4-type zinc finger protein [Rubrobacter calidifluminis]